MSLLQKMFGKRQNRTHPYCAALIAAAGSSTRYGGENKLLQTLDGIPVLVRTLLTIDRVEGIDEIVIAAREDELLPYAELCKTFGLRKPVKVIVGGATRTESVLRAALEASPETEFFAVQDGARPLVTVELIRMTRRPSCSASCASFRMRSTCGHTALTTSAPRSRSASSVALDSPWARMSTVSPAFAWSGDVMRRMPRSSISRTTPALCTMLPSIAPPRAFAVSRVRLTARSTP